jgi:hypothetical protein
MSYAPRPNEFVPYFEAPAALAHRVGGVRRRGLLRRIFGGIFESREEQAERNAADFVARTGGRLTDEIERQITDRIIRGSGWR